MKKLLLSVIIFMVVGVANAQPVWKYGDDGWAYLETSTKVQGKFGFVENNATMYFYVKGPNIDEAVAMTVMVDGYVRIIEGYLINRYMIAFSLDEDLTPRILDADIMHLLVRGQIYKIPLKGFNQAATLVVDSLL